VGNVGVELFRQYIKTYLASVKPTETYNVTDKKFSRPKPIKKEIRMGNEDKSSVSLGWYVKEKYSQTLSAQTKVYQQYMDIILLEHMRMK
jgi:hypothetical protein